MRPAVRMVIDTDPGIDDAIAIWSVLADRGVELLGLTTVFGNVGLPLATRNARLLLDAVGRSDVPIHSGAARPMLSARVPGAVEVHGEDGLGGLASELGTAVEASISADAASERLIRLAREHPGEIRVLALGPLTNIALAILRDPHFAGNLHSLTLMGGAVLRGGNVTEHAEANVWNDPEAAQIVFSSGAPITVVPLDITETQRLDARTRAELGLLGDPSLRLLDRMLGRYFDFYARASGAGDIPLHDPLAALLATGRAVPTEVRRGRIEIVLSGDERGRTSWTEDGSGSVALPLAVDVDTGSTVLGLLQDLDAELEGKTT